MIPHTYVHGYIVLYECFIVFCMGRLKGRTVL